jgi:hypothetical protein
MSLRSGILTVVAIGMTDMTLATRTIVTTSSRSSSTLIPNQDPKAVMPFVTTSGTASTTMSGTTKIPRAEIKVMMREGTVASARIVAGKCGNGNHELLHRYFVLHTCRCLPLPSFCSTYHYTPTTFLTIGTARMWSATTMSRARTMCAWIISAVGIGPVTHTTTAGIAASRASVKIAPTALGSVAMPNIIAAKHLAWRLPISAKPNAMCASARATIPMHPRKQFENAKPSVTTAAMILSVS